MSYRQSNQPVDSNQASNQNFNNFARYVAPNAKVASSVQASTGSENKLDPRFSQGHVPSPTFSISTEGSTPTRVTRDSMGVRNYVTAPPTNSGAASPMWRGPSPEAVTAPNQSNWSFSKGNYPRFVTQGMPDESSTFYKAAAQQAVPPDLSRLSLHSAQYPGPTLPSRNVASNSPSESLASETLRNYPPEARQSPVTRPGLIPRPAMPHTNYPSTAQSGVSLASDTQQLPRPDLSPFGVARRIKEGDISENYLASLQNASNMRNQSGSQNLAKSAEATLNASMNSFLPVACSEQVFKPVLPCFMRLSVGMFPNAPSFRSKFPFPVGAVVQPLAEPPTGEDTVPVVNFGKAGIIRCRRCRAYINYLSMFVDGGRKFRCNFCGFLSDVPSEYYCPLDNSGKRLDANERPELTCGSVDFVAPSEYMVRPPMPPTYLFVIDVSSAAVSCGALNGFVSSIRQSLDFLLGDDRTRVGIITFDSTIHFYGLKSSSDNPNGKLDPIMAVVSDVDDVFLPIPHGCLVKLCECRESLEILLDRLESMFTTTKDGGGAVGSAVSAAYLLLQTCGGRLILMTSSKPTRGVGALSKSALEGGERNSPGVVGTDKERQYLEPDNTFYKKTAVNMSRAQISCDIILCTSTHSELATLTPLAKYTGGEILYLPKFELSKDYVVLIRSLRRMVSRETAWEGVMRIRCTRSVKCHGFLGRFFMRSTDLLTLPNTDSDKTYGVEFVLEDNDIRTEAFAAQCAVLYTASGGERRVRIHTVAIPVTRNMADLFGFAEVGAMTNLSLRTCADAVLNKNFETVRKELTDSLVQGLVRYQQGGSQMQSQYSAATSLSNQLALPEPLRLLPLYIQGILKSPLLCREASVAASMLLDDKSFLHSLVDIFSIPLSSAFVYPNIVPLFPLDEETNANSQVGLISSSGPLSVQLPEGLRASAAHVLHSHRVVLIDEGVNLWIWFGSSVKPSFVQELVMETNEEIASEHNGAGSSISPQYLARAFRCAPKPGYTSSASRARALVASILSCRLPWTPIRVVFQGDPLEARILSLMVEDRTVNQPSYTEFLSSIQRQVQSRLTNS